MNIINKKIISITLTAMAFMSVSFLACTKENPVPPTEDIAVIPDETVIEEVTEDVINTPEEETVENTKDVYCFDFYKITDLKDENSVQKSTRTILKDSDEEKEFKDKFLEDGAYETLDYPECKVYYSDSSDGFGYVFVFEKDESEYPKFAYGCTGNKEDNILLAKYDADCTFENIFDNMYTPDEEEFYADHMKPFADYQETAVYETDEETGVTIFTYSHDPKKYGTFNSTGTVYEIATKPCYKHYYQTSGERYLFYFFDEEKLVRIVDFGGIAYTGLEDNPDTEYGIEVYIYYFQE